MAVMSTPDVSNDANAEQAPDNPRHVHVPVGKYIEAAALLSHVQNLESRLQDTKSTSFGHRKAPELYLCRIPNPEATQLSRIQHLNLPVVAMMAVTERCISAQLLKESVGCFGPPVEVLVVSKEDTITAVAMVPLERPELSADDSMVVTEEDEILHQQHQTQQLDATNAPKSLMSGGMVSKAPLPRLAIVVGTKSSRVISVEFSIKQNSMQLLRRNYYEGKEMKTYFEPFPRNVMTPHQLQMPQMSARQSHWLRRHRTTFPNYTVPFSPSGGVSSIVPYSIPTKNGSKSEKFDDEQIQSYYTKAYPTHIWIAFGDGTGLRIHHAGFFPSVIQKHTDAVMDHKKRQFSRIGIESPSLEETLGQPLIKWQAHLPTAPTDLSPSISDSSYYDQMVVIPIPKYHPTPLAAATNSSSSPFPTSWNDAYQLGVLGKAIQLSTSGSGDGGHDDSFKDARTDDESSTGGSDKQQHGTNVLMDLDAKERGCDWWEDYEAVVYCRKTYDNSFPTLVFYTSEDQYPGRLQADLQELIQDSFLEERKSDSSKGDGNPIAAIVGGFFGIFGGGGREEEPKRNEDRAVDRTNDPAAGAEKNASESFWDPSIPFPDINRAPINLYAGVEIFDAPRQITQCIIDPYGAIAALSDNLGRVSLLDLTTKQIIRLWKGYRDTSCNWLQVAQDYKTKATLYLVIHSRQRRVVEVWEMTHGARVKTFQVGRDTQVVSCRQLFHGGYLWTCYVAHSNVPFSNMNQLERIEISSESAEVQVNEEIIDNPRMAISVKRTREAASRMNRLQQLLDQTNVECESLDVFKALEDIDSLSDLATCLDNIAVSPVLEERMGVQGSEFQRLAMSHCRLKLDEAIRVGGEESLTNPHVELLAFKLAYYTQVTNAFEILRKYELSNRFEDISMDVKQPNNWGLEAAGWTSTYLIITKRLIDADVIPPPIEPMMFHEFCMCIREPKEGKNATFDEASGGYTLYLSDSSRTRRDIISRVFRPFVSDVFSLQVVTQLFESLGIGKDFEYQLRCFGEWFVGLSVKVATKNAVFAAKSPSIRWLKEIVSRQVDYTPSGETIAPMKSLYRFCRESEDLVRAFWLATLCRQSIFEVANEKEEQSYGAIDSRVIIDPWDNLLRKLRVCLLVSLRLHKHPLGACPISVKAVEKKENFSVFEWLARDELTMSHKQDEIVSLEMACRISSRAFDPSKPEGDDPSQWKTVQRSCLSAALDESDREEHLIGFDDDERLGALHLFLKPHNIEHVLTPHRVLLLAKKWARKPRKLEILEDTITTLKSIDVSKHKKLAYATKLDLWQNHIRPIYRSLLLGFGDVPEVSEEVIAPLLNDSVWLNSFSKLSSTILSLIEEVKCEKDEDMCGWDALVAEREDTWPPVRDCFLLQRLVQKNRVVNQSALEAHLTFLYALKISQDVWRLTECIPSFFDLFDTSAIFNDVRVNEEIEEKQHEFMQDSIVAYAKNYNGPSMDCLNLGDIDVLADLWDFDMLNVNTLFLLSMYEFGKDAVVDEVLTKSASLISVQHFVDEGVDIMCRRLNNVLNVNPSVALKKILGTLDADVCEWVKEKAESSEPLTNAKFDVKVGSTHLFGLRLLSLAASSDISKEERIKIHSLIVLSGTIVKSLETDKGTGGVIGHTLKRDQKANDTQLLEQTTDSTAKVEPTLDTACETASRPLRETVDDSSDQVVLEPSAPDETSGPELMHETEMTDADSNMKQNSNSYNTASNDDN